MGNRKWGLVAFLLLLVLLFAFNRKDIEVVNIDNYKLTSISSAGYDLSSTLSVYNPNLLSSTIKSIYISYSSEGVKLGVVDFQAEQGIPGRKTTSLPVSIRFTNAEFDKLLIDSLQSSLKVKAHGEIVFSNLFGGGRVEIHEVDTLSK